MNKVVVTIAFLGIWHMQVCADKSATEEEILSVCNRENPSGTSNGWSEIVKEGEGAPVECGDDPSRLHILVSC